MTLIIQKPTAAKVVLRKGWQPMDADAAAYITAVETADTEPLEERTKIAIDNFVLGCKADGIWSAIKASCILAGARTLTGALVPLVGTAPTNVSFVSGDYNRKTGLVGDGSTKYLNSNRANNADPQNSQHLSVHITQQGGTALGSLIGAATGSTGSSYFYKLGTTFNTCSRANNVEDTVSASGGFVAINRANSAQYTVRANSTVSTFSRTSVTPISTAIYVFGLGTDYPSFNSNARLAFYSIGESLNLALLDARVTDLINAFGAAIP
jgi:hypothetical protein